MLSISLEAVVVGLHLRWMGVWQRPNHVLSRIARLVPVLVVEEPLASDSDTNELVERDGVTVLTPHRTRVTSEIDATTLAAVRRWLGSRGTAIWLYSPMMLPLADAFPDAPLIYDKMDQLSAFLGADSRIEAREDALLARATVVFAGGASLWKSVRARATRGLPLPSGVDLAHFAAALEVEPHAALRNARRPIFGYVGVIDERLDLALIERLAEARPDATIALIGPVAKIDPTSLPQRDNIVYLGMRSYAELPALLAAFDVALMPFAIGPATEFISPTKTLEYLAAGRPVVSTPVPDVVSAFSDVVAIAQGPAAFIAAVAEAEKRAAHMSETGRNRAATMSWDGVVARMIAETNDAVAKRDPRAVSK